MKKLYTLEVIVHGIDVYNRTVIADSMEVVANGSCLAFYKKDEGGFSVEVAVYPTSCTIVKSIGTFKEDVKPAVDEHYDTYHGGLV